MNSQTKKDETQNDPEQTTADDEETIQKLVNSTANEEEANKAPGNIKEVTVTATQTNEPTAAPITETSPIQTNHSAEASPIQTNDPAVVVSILGAVMTSLWIVAILPRLAGTITQVVVDILVIVESIPEVEVTMG
jgi:hypothetical protein